MMAEGEREERASVAACEDFGELAALVPELTATRLLDELARHWSPKVRTAVAARPDAPTKMLVHMQADEDHDVRVAVQRQLSARAPRWGVA